MRCAPCVLGLALCPFAAVAAAAEDADGFHATPSLYWKSGDHRIDLGAALRLRTEVWDAFADDVEAYTGLRTRLRVQYGWKDRLSSRPSSRTCASGA